MISTMKSIGENVIAFANTVEGTTLWRFTIEIQVVKCLTLTKLYRRKMGQRILLLYAAKRSLGAFYMRNPQSEPR